MKLRTIAISLGMALFLAASVGAAGSSQQDQGAGGMQNGGAAQDNAPVTEIVIMEVQQDLNDQGYNAGTPDGKLNPATQQALRDFQKAKNLPQTGQPDKQTRTALGVKEKSSDKGGGSNPVKPEGDRGARGQQDSNSQAP